MKTESFKVEKTFVSPQSEGERQVFLGAKCTPDVAEVEVRAPFGGFVHSGVGAASLDEKTVLALRYSTPEQLYAMAALFVTLGRAMEAMRPLARPVAFVRPVAYVTDLQPPSNGGPTR